MNLPSSVQRLATVDYCDGLGIAVGSRAISLVHSTKRLFQVGLKTTRTVPLPETDEDHLPAIRRALADFLADLGALPDQVVLCLPRIEASVSRLVVPEAARGSLEQVVRYEVERLLPFREEEIYYDYVTTEEGGEERRIGVVVFCFPRQAVDPLVNLLVEHNLRPQSVTLSSAAQTTALLACCPAEHRQVLAAREDGRLELNFLRERQLVASYTVPVARVAEADAWTDTLAHSIARNFPGSAPDTIPVFTWDEHGTLPVSVETDRDLAHAAQEQFPVVAADGTISAVTCSAIGAALQAVGERGDVNVLPVENRARREKLLSPLTLVFVGCILVLSLVWAASVVIQGHRALSRVQDQIQALDPAVRSVQDDEAAVQRLLAQLQTLRSETRLRLTPLLKDVSERIPQDFYLTTFQFKNGKVELKGVARTGSASDLVGVLEASPCLQNVAPKAPFKTSSQGETFTLGAQVNVCG